MLETKYEVLNPIKESEEKRTTTQSNDDIRIVDINLIKEGLLRLMLIKRYGKEPTRSDLQRFIKFINVEYESNSSKNSVDKRIESICRQLDKKIEKFDKITHF